MPPNQNSMDEKVAPANKAYKPGVVAVAAEEVARLDRRIAEKRSKASKEKLQSLEDDVMAKEPRGEAPSVPGVVVSGSAFEEVVVKNKVVPQSEGPGLDEKKDVMEDNYMSKKKEDEVAMDDAVFKKEEMAPVVQEKDLDMKENVPMEAMPAVSPMVTTTADHGVVQEPDVEYGVYEPNEDGLAVAVAVTEDDDDVFIPSAVEYDPDAKPPLHRNRRFRLYGFLAFFALVACAVGATVGIVLSKDDGDVELHPRERLGISALVERVVGQQKLEQGDSPYAKALNWMIFDDPMELIPEDVNFVQRYILAYFAFAMQGEKQWFTCGPPNVTLGHTDACTWQELGSTNPILRIAEPRFRWLSGTHECDWAGIRCDLDKQVRAVEFGGQNLEGVFPEGLQHLPFLQSLELPMNEIRGPIPPEVATMKHLVNVEISYNQLTGSLPDAFYEMKSMIRINLEHNELGGQLSPKIAQMRDLKGLFLSNNDFSGPLPTEIGSLQSLTYLRLTENRFNGKLPSQMGDLLAMQELWLSDNDFSGEIPAGIGNMRNAGDFRLRRNPRLGGQWPFDFWQNSRLTWLDIRGCNFTGSLGPGIGSMENLVHLRLSGNPFNGTVPTEIGNLRFLKSLWIDRTDITGTMPQEICEKQTHKAFADMNADCLGDVPELACPCCTGCCLPDGTGCKKMD